MFAKANVIARSRKAPTVNIPFEKLDGAGTFFQRLFERELPKPEAGHAVVLVLEFVAQSADRTEGPALAVGDRLGQAGGNQPLAEFLKLAEHVAPQVRCRRDDRREASRERSPRRASCARR